MHLALADLYRAKWTAKIHDEWIQGLLRDRPDLTQSQLQRTRELMDSHTRDSLVTDYESLIPTVSLPDPNDRHVLAAAIWAGADTIVTFNLADFPATAMGLHGIVAVHPDEFIAARFDSDPVAACTAARRQRASLKHPPLTVDEFLAVLQRNGLPRTLAILRRHAERI